MKIGDPYGEPGGAEPAPEPAMPRSFAPFAWLRQVNVPPTVAPTPGRPLCYEQMHKVRFEWWTTSTDDQGRIVQRGPYPSEYAARRFVASLT